MLVDIINNQIKSESVALIVVNNQINNDLLANIDERCQIKLLRRQKGSKSPIPWIALNMLLWKLHPDIIHFHLEGMRRMVFHPATKVFTIHNTNTSGHEYNHYQALFAISEAVRRHTQEQGFKATTIYNGICPDRIAIKCVKAAADFYKFVCVGRLYTPHKGQDVLVEAAGKLIEKGIKNVHIDFIGDGPSRVELEKLIRNFGLQEHITLLGSRRREYVYQHLRDYDLFILPSRSEGFGLSVAEAMCARIPVLTSNLDGPMEVIDNGRLGMSFKSGDAADLSRLLCLFIRQGVNNTLLDEARQFAMKNFDIAVSAKKYIDEYRKVIG